MIIDNTVKRILTLEICILLELYKLTNYGNNNNNEMKNTEKSTRTQEYTLNYI